jgi:hypothetical protein
MYGGHKTEGALYDAIFGRPLYLSPNTQYAFTPVESNAKQILQHIYASGLIELGASQGLSLEKLVKDIGSKSKFESDYDDTQIPQNPPLGAPPVEYVINYAKNLLLRTI